MESSAGKKIIAKLPDEDKEALLEKSGEPEKDIYVFFSFDLVGSTKFKTDEPEKWPYVIFKFYEFIFKELSRRIPQVTVWKYLGDEILLYVSVREFESDSGIYKVPEYVFSIQSKVSSDIQNLFPEEKLDLDIKSTVWVAGAVTVKPQETDRKQPVLVTNVYQNLRMKLPFGDQLQDDFLGPDMDAGFRVAKYAYSKKVVLSADFAYLLLRMKKPRRVKSIDGKMKIVSLEALKGVWKDKYYPIIWYCDDWKSADKDFSYAAYKDNKLVENVLSGRTEPIGKLEIIYDELGKTEDVDKFVEECESIISNKEDGEVLTFSV